MNNKFFCYNCLLSIIYMNCFEFGLLYYLISYIIFSVIFYFIKNNTAIKLIRLFLCSVVSVYFIYKLITITNRFFNQKTLIVPIIVVIVYSAVKRFESVSLINKYAFVCSIIFLLIPCLMYTPQITLKALSFSKINELPMILALSALPFSFNYKTTLKAFPIYLLFNYIFIFSTKEGMGIIGISENINIDFIFSTLELVYIFGLYLTVMPVIATACSYIVDYSNRIFNKTVPFLKKHRLIII